MYLFVSINQCICCIKSVLCFCAIRYRLTDAYELYVDGTHHCGIKIYQITKLNTELRMYEH